MLPIAKTVKSCNTCRYNLKSNGVNYCKLFRYLTVLPDNSKKSEYYVESKDCRSDEKLCGPGGIYYKEP